MNLTLWIGDESGAAPRLTIAEAGKLLEAALPRDTGDEVDMARVTTDLIVASLTAIGEARGYTVTAAWPNVSMTPRGHVEFNDARPIGLRRARDGRAQVTTQAR